EFGAGAGQQAEVLAVEEAVEAAGDLQLEAAQGAFGGEVGEFAAAGVPARAGLLRRVVGGGGAAGGHAVVTGAAGWSHATRGGGTAGGGPARAGRRRGVGGGGGRAGGHAVVTDAAEWFHTTRGGGTAVRIWAMTSPASTPSARASKVRTRRCAMTSRATARTSSGRT